MRQDNLTRGRWWLGLGLSLFFASVRVTFGEGLVLHDDFDTSALILPDKWESSETRRPNSIREATRYVDGGKLYLSAVGYGGMRSNEGRQTGTFGLGVKTSGLITALQAELTVTDRVAQACPENRLSTQGRAQLVGFFFNDGSRSAEGDLTGDIVAVMEKVVDSQAGQFIRGLVLRCTSWSCSSGEMIKALLFKRPWVLNQPDVLRMEWEPSESQFVFSVNPESDAAQTRRIGYDKASGSSQPPTRQLQRIRVRHHGANCESGRRVALMSVAVDDVYLRFLDPKTAFGLGSKATLAVTPPSRSVTADITDWD